MPHWFRLFALHGVVFHSNKLGLMERQSELIWEVCSIRIDRDFRFGLCETRVFGWCEMQEVHLLAIDRIVGIEPFTECHNAVSISSVNANATVRTPPVEFNVDACNRSKVICCDDTERYQPRSSFVASSVRERERFICGCKCLGFVSEGEQGRTGSKGMHSRSSCDVVVHSGCHFVKVNGSGITYKVTCPRIPIPLTKNKHDHEGQTTAGQVDRLVRR